jgi:hypothetical protein
MRRAIPEKKMQISRREKILIVVCVAFLAGVVFWILSSSGKAGAGRNLVPYEEAVAKTQVALKTAKKMDEDQKEIDRHLGKSAFDLPAEELTPHMIRDLQTLAAKANVHLREIKPMRARAVASGSGTRLPMEVRFRAPFQPDVVRFLYYVENPATRMVVEKVNMTSADIKQKDIDVSAQITIFTRSTAGASGAEGGETGNATNQASKS